MNRLRGTHLKGIKYLKNVVRRFKKKKKNATVNNQILISRRFVSNYGNHKNISEDIFKKKSNDIAVE